MRVIEYEIEGIEDPEPLYRLVKTLHDPREGPADELAALYPQRWEIEGLLDEFKTHLRGGPRWWLFHVGRHDRAVIMRNRSRPF